MRYQDYLSEIEKRKEFNLSPKPIEDDQLLSEIISNIKDLSHQDRESCINFFIYNTLPGTTKAAHIKSQFLKEIIQDKINVKEISIDFAFELLSHMKGGPSVKVLLDIALSEMKIAKKLFYLG